MSTQRYSVTPHPIETLLTRVKSGEIAIPEIQRPFVWEAVKVRDLLDSLSRGYPAGYLIAWRKPPVKLKDGSSSKGKRILIDGQQRNSRRRSTSYEPISARKWSRGHHGTTRSTATLGVKLDPGGVAEGSRGLSAKRDTPGTRGQESPSTPKGSQSRCVHEARVGEGDRKRRVALPPVPGAGNFANEREFREPFSQLKTGEVDFISKTHFDRFTMILRAAGYVTSELIRAQNAVNFAYVLWGTQPGTVSRLTRGCRRKSGAATPWLFHIRNSRIANVEWVGDGGSETAGYSCRAQALHVRGAAPFACHRGDRARNEPIRGSCGDQTRTGVAPFARGGDG